LGFHTGHREACSERRLRRPRSLHIGFSYGTPRWVQFSNRVSANTHKEFA
jgi:hypothetical protein